jgi:hypothetical protein
MYATAHPRLRGARPSIVLLLVLGILMLAGLAAPTRAADPSAAPAAAGSPIASEAPQTMCGSVADLRLYLGFVRDQAANDGGLLPILVGTVASLGEARTLAGLVAETYRPLVDDLVAALQSLRTSIRGFSDAGTVGSGLVAVGEAIVDIGTRMDALSAALSEPCPAASPAPSAPAASPAA